jgi:hypothetical protein
MTVGCSRSGRRRACLLWQMPSDSVTLRDPALRSGAVPRSRSLPRSPGLLAPRPARRRQTVTAAINGGYPARCDRALLGSG